MSKSIAAALRQQAAAAIVFNRWVQELQKPGATEAEFRLALTYYDSNVRPAAVELMEAYQAAGQTADRDKVETGLRQSDAQMENFRSELES